MNGQRASEEDSIPNGYVMALKANGWKKGKARALPFYT